MATKTAKKTHNLKPARVNKISGGKKPAKAAAALVSHKSTRK